MYRTLAISLTLAASIAATGCNKQKEPSTSQSESAVGKAPQAQPGTSVVSPSSEQARSPAMLAGGVGSPAATPEEVVTAFLEALRSGNDELADQLLSTQARLSARREGYDLSPPGTPSDVYRVGSAQFVSATQDGAHVPTQWTATFPGGQTEKWDITWVLRREADLGWRVTGMKAQLFPNDPMRFLNFENFAEVRQQLAQAEKDLAGSASGGVRQASASSDDGHNQNRNAFPQ